MFENIMAHLKEQVEKRQYLNALVSVSELQALLLKEYSSIQKSTLDPSVCRYCGQPHYQHSPDCRQYS